MRKMITIEENRMAKKENLFTGKTHQTRAEVGEFLMQLGEKVTNGQVTLRQAGDDLVLDLPANLGMKVNVTRKAKPANGSRVKLNLKLAWREGDQEEPLALG